MELEGCAGEVFHIGSRQEISIGDLFDLIAELMQSDARAVCVEERIRPTGSEVLRLCCDNGKLLKATGFTPQISLRDGLLRPIEWFQNPNNLRRYKENIYNV